MCDNYNSTTDTNTCKKLPWLKNVAYNAHTYAQCKQFTDLFVHIYVCTCWIKGVIPKHGISVYSTLLQHTQQFLTWNISIQYRPSVYTAIFLRGISVYSTIFQYIKQFLNMEYRYTVPSFSIYCNFFPHGISVYSTPLQYTLQFLMWNIGI